MIDKLYIIVISLIGNYLLTTPDLLTNSQNYYKLTCFGLPGNEYLPEYA